jgi:hypothetical protein
VESAWPRTGLIFCAALLQALYRRYALCARRWPGGRRRSEPELGAIRHPGVQVEQGAGVVAFLVREPVLIAGGGDGPVAAEAYRVTASVVLLPVLETGAGLEVEAGRDDVQICCGHVLACFQTPERSRSVSLFYACHLIPLRLALTHEIGNEFWSELGFVALGQRVWGAGAGLEVDGLLQQARDALHFELDCGGGDAPLVSAAHDVHLSHAGVVDGDATWDALLIRFARAAFVLLLGWDPFVFQIDRSSA